MTEIVPAKQGFRVSILHPNIRLMVEGRGCRVGFAIGFCGAERAGGSPAAEMNHV
jgi:hypothetical protein